MCGEWRSVGKVQRWAFFKNWLKRSATKRKSSVKSRNATQLAQSNF